MKAACKDKLEKVHEVSLSFYHFQFLWESLTFTLGSIPLRGLVVISLVPRGSSLKEVLVKLSVTANLVHLVNDLVTLHKDEETTPNKISIARSLSQEEGTFRVLLEQSLNLLHMGLGIIPR
jgi:hypothetical protein